jgi:hypothetical protein
VDSRDDNSCCDNCQGQLDPGSITCGGCGAECDPDKARGFRKNRRIERGDTIVVDYDLLDFAGNPVDLSNPAVKVWFTIKNFLSDADQNALAQVTLGAGITARDSPASGHVRVKVPATVTQFITEGTTRLYYDLQLEDAGGIVRTVEKGLFLVDPDVTRATS